MVALNRDGWCWFPCSILLEYMNAGSLEDIVRVMPNNRIPEDVLGAITGAILVGLRYS